MAIGLMQLSQSKNFSVSKIFLLLHICEIKGKPFGIMCVEANKSENRPKGRERGSANTLNHKFGRDHVVST